MLLRNSKDCFAHISHVYYCLHWQYSKELASQAMPTLPVLPTHTELLDWIWRTADDSWHFGI